MLATFYNVLPGEHAKIEERIGHVHSAEMFMFENFASMWSYFKENDTDLVKFPALKFIILDLFNSFNRYRCSMGLWISYLEWICCVFPEEMLFFTWSSVIENDLDDGGMYGNGWGRGESSLKSAFKLSRSYHRLQVGFGCVYKCRCRKLIWTCLVWAGRSTPGTFKGANLATQLRHRWAEMNHSGNYTESEPVSRFRNSIVPNARLWSATTYM